MPEYPLKQQKDERATVLTTSQPHSRFLPLGILFLIIIAYATVVVAHWNEGYIDFGDGNYMYISWRLTQGAVLYRDILAPQPPMHFVVGWILAKIAQVAQIRPLYVFRCFSLLLHALMIYICYKLTQRVAALVGIRGQKAAWFGVTAALVYTLLPIGFWWSLGYQSEPLEIVFLYSALALLIGHMNTQTAVGAGILTALATLTNMTAAPYALLFVAYLAIRERRYFLPYVGALVAVWGGVTVACELLTGAYLENVILNQVGSFPRKEFLPEGETLLTYALRKILQEGRDVLVLEGGAIVLALLALVRLTAERRQDSKTELVAWGFLSLMLSIVYVSKGGTMDYIFSIGEPAVAVLATMVLASTWGRLRSWSPRKCFHSTSPVASIFAYALLLIVMFAPGIGFIWGTLKQRSYELDEYRTKQIVELIREKTQPGDEILSPPYYAFLAQRKIVADYSEIFLWTLKYYNEKQDKTPGRGIEAVEKITRALEEKKIRLVILDLDQTGRIPEIKKAIETHYRPIRTTELKTLNTRLMIYEPAG